jgi:hypothetical protein
VGEIKIDRVTEMKKMVALERMEGGRGKQRERENYNVFFFLIFAGGR